MEIALVTGAARGIGAAIARRLAAGGVMVGVTDIDLDKASAFAAELRGNGYEALPAYVDVTELASLQAAAALLVERYGDLTMLVNNAGVARGRMLHRLTDEDWQIVQDVIAGGTFNGFRAVAPWFRDRGRRPRRVVNVASIAGVHGSAGASNYAAAKAGVVSLTLTMAREWAPFAVTVNAVAPGFIATRLTSSASDAPAGAGFSEAAREEIVGRIPLGRAGLPEDVAAAVAFFCSPDAGYITGQVLEVHGGLNDISPPLRVG
jgi:3-oxoacyl-[acyl-carrier protein] reductase